MGALEQHLVTEKVSISHDNYICRTWYSRQGTRNLLREYPQLRKLSVLDCFFVFFSLMKTIQKVRVCRRSAQTLLLCEQWRKKKKLVSQAVQAEECWKMWLDELSPEVGRSGNVHVDIIFITFFYFYYWMLK